MWTDARGPNVLPAPECLRLLAVRAKQGGVGRIGVATDQAPVIVPTNFTLEDGRILLRVGRGFFSRAAAGHLVAFEVDDVDLESRTAWSVLVRGMATLIEEPSPNELAVTATPLVPEPGNLVLALRPDLLTGRRFELRPASL